MLSFRYPDRPITTTPEVANMLDVGGGWVAQPKYDGWRVEICYSDVAKMYTRIGGVFDNSVKTPVPQSIKSDLASLKVPMGTVLDCEYVGPRGHLPPSIYIFDCLAWNGQWLMKTAFEDRWKFCSTVQPKGETVFLSPLIESGFVDTFNRLKADWIANGCNIDLYEGIVLKRKSGTLILAPNKNADSNHMMKCKYRDIRREIR